MTLAETYLDTLDAGANHKAHAAFTRLVREREAPIHGGDLRPILEWLCTQLDELNGQLGALRNRQNPEFHNPENGT